LELYTSHYVSVSPPHVHHPHLHSFPTRRSSDLQTATAARRSPTRRCRESSAPGSGKLCETTSCSRGCFCPSCHPSSAASRRLSRSEEHTSELQSRSDLVCRLLLEKKKKIK